jgi:hypothetical protein
VGGSSAEVVSIGAGGTRRPDYARLASGQVAAARHHLGLSLDDFARLVYEQTGWDMLPEGIAAWEDDELPPGDVVYACIAATQGLAAAASLLAGVPPGFPAETLAGHWVTAYQFAHAGQPHHHADIARVTAESGSRIRAVNHPPEPRSEGRERPFRNEIEATLAGRHLIGEWQNTSDTRYCGALQLAVLPGEIVMQGYYTGVGSDIEVSANLWTWVRIDPASIPDAGLAAVTLRKPQDLYELVMAHNQYGEPLTLADVTEEH